MTSADDLLLQRGGGGKGHTHYTHTLQGHTSVTIKKKNYEIFLAYVRLSKMYYY